MREYKFKGKSKVHKNKWFYGNLIVECEHGVCDYSITGMLQDHPVHGETVCQYSELKDCKGVEIYDGDNYTYGIHKGTVSYICGAFRCLEKIRYGRTSIELYDIHEEIEVIGNIHDNE